MDRIIFIICFLTGITLYAQQNEEFKNVQEYYNYHRYTLSKEFKTKFDKEKAPLLKTKIQNTYFEIMKKIDSLENNTYIHALIITKNKENLDTIFPGNKTNPENVPVKNTSSSSTLYDKLEKEAHYPDGINELRKEITRYFHLKELDENVTTANATITFVVEKNGQITNVKAEGDNHLFNRQAEIAAYRLKHKFIPAYIDGKPVRYKFKIPITMHFK